MEALGFHEAHYCSLESQSNVYGTARVDLPNGTHKILIASLRGMIVSTEFLNAKPLSREVHFTYIPGIKQAKILHMTGRDNKKWGGPFLQNYQGQMD